MKISEMKSYLSLIPISARVRRKQNRLILLCIMFAVFLVTTVFSYAEIMTKGEEGVMLRKHGRHHIAVSGLSEEAAAQIASRDDVEASAWHQAFGEDIYEGYEIDTKRVIFYGTQKTYMEDIREYECEGDFPQHANEVMLNEIAKERLGVQAGEQITIDTPAGAFDYTVTGFCVDEWQLYNNAYEGVCAYLTLEALTDICSANGYATNAALYLRFVKGTDIREAITGLQEQYGLRDGAIQENMITMGLAGESSNQTVNGFYALAAMVFGLILIAGVLMISSCMNSTVSQRTKFFGLMRCIGASREQVMRFVRLEALNWCKTAIPAGLAISVVFTWFLSRILQQKAGGEFKDYPFRFSVIGIIFGILVGLVTVLLAAHFPARRAAKVSPVAAVSGNMEVSGKVSHGANTRFLKIESALGIYHAVSAKKNLVFMSLSFAFSVILFLVFFAGLDFVKKLLPSEGNLNPDISIASADNTNSLSGSMEEEMAKLPGVEAAFRCAISFAVPVAINGTEDSIDLISYDDYMFAWSGKSIVSGDMTKVSGDTDYVLTIFNQDSRLDTGDVIRINDTELEIAGVLSEGVGTEARPAVVCTEETYRRITGESGYMLLNAQLAKDVPEETIDALRQLAGANEFQDRRTENKEMNSSFWVFRIAAYGFLSIISLITVFNIVNNISMSVSAKMKQYGAMRAVGMSVEQMIRMIAMEAAAYAVCGLVIGYAGGMFLHRLIMNKLVYSHFGGSWKIPAEPLIIITIIVVISCAVAVYTPARRIRDMVITETIHTL